MKPLLGRFAGPAYALLRIAAGILFAFHGAQKLFGMFGGNQAPLLSQFWFAGVIELVGGVLIAIGLFTSVAALIASAEMVVAYVQAHAPRGTWPIQNGGELALLYCVVFLYIASRGGGAWSLDR
ncbi:MAG TPA: DoxX family protein [Vicinamibacterales bacterium]|nr:DoxX family protein [Vicinamibacterales bacterium]